MKITTLFFILLATAVQAQTWTTATPIPQWVRAGNTAAYAKNLNCNTEIQAIEKNGWLTLQLCLPQNSHIRATILDLSGRVIQSEKEITVAAGKQSIPIDTSGFSKGIYCLSLSVNGSPMSKKIILGN